MKPHLSVIVNDERREHLNPTYFKQLTPITDHPVFGIRAIEQKAHEAVAQAAFKDVPYGPTWALTVLALAVGGNPVATKRAGEALEVLAAHLSTAAPSDDAPVHGIPRPDVPGGAA